MSEVVDSIVLSTRKGATEMVAIGQLLSSLTLNVICAEVSSLTTVGYYLLLEDQDFLKQASKANNIDELCEWVNENY